MTVHNLQSVKNKLSSEIQTSVLALGALRFEWNEGLAEALFSGMSDANRSALIHTLVRALFARDYAEETVKHVYGCHCFPAEAVQNGCKIVLWFGHEIAKSETGNPKRALLICIERFLQLYASLFTDEEADKMSDLFHKTMGGLTDHILMDILSLPHYRDNLLKRFGVKATEE